MDAKVTLTTRCGAKCKTCPVWKTKTQEITVENWKMICDKLNSSPLIDRILLNNTGDLFYHNKRDDILEVVEKGKRGKPVILTTNASAMHRIPWVDELIISFNGGTKEAYERTTGLSYDIVVRNVKRLYKEIRRKVKHAEIHCLICELNKGTEAQLLELWKDFPGRVRVSYKYDNQMQDDLTIGQYKTDNRIPCDYLLTVNVMPDGTVISCAHDFWVENRWGNLLTDSIEEVIQHPGRLAKMEEHVRGVWTGLCEKCNYNTPITEGKIVYLK